MTSYSQARRNLINAVLVVMDATKTVAYFQRALNRAVLDFYRDDITAFDFVDTMIRLIEDQFRRAWNEGARAVGYDPEDMTFDDQFTLLSRIEREKEYILDFAGAIENARLNEQPVGPLQARVPMWANRYNEVVSYSQTYFGKLERFEWVLGPTEHCDSCLTLAGTVATGQQWVDARATGIYPQSNQLQCGGYNCQCELRKTDKPLTSGNIPSI